MEKGQFFESIEGLSLPEKVARIAEVYTTPKLKEEAVSIIPLVISRAKDADLGLRIKLLRNNLPQKNAYEAVKQLLNEERQLRKRIENQNLPDNLNLEKYLKDNFRPSTENRTKKILKLAASFLSEKREMDEKVGEKDCKTIENEMLSVQYYKIYRDQMNRIVHMCFRFQGQKIKRIGFKFFDAVLTEYKTFEVAILFNLLEGDYLSLEMYKILSKHINLISQIRLLDKVLEELKRIQKADRYATSKEKQRMTSLIEKYEITLREQCDAEFKETQSFVEQMASGE